MDNSSSSASSAPSSGTSPAAGRTVGEVELTPEQDHELRRQARVVLGRLCAKEKDILGWGRALFPDKFHLPFCKELHDYLVQIRHDPFTSTEAPRNHAKTLIRCFLVPLFQALEEPESFRHYLNVQATQEKAHAINIAIKSELENNRELREIYGDMVGEKWSDGQFVLSNGVVFTAISAGQSIRGIQYKSDRPDYIMVDDLYNEDDIYNLDATRKKNQWFWGSLYPARAKSRPRCCIHLQGTAINQEDLLEKLKKNKGRWACRTFKAIIDWRKKKVLWPELNTFEQLMQERSDMGSVIFLREMQNERRDDAESIIKEAWVKEYDPSTIIFGKNFYVSEVVIGVDPSIGEKMQNDYTGIVLALKCRYADSDAEVYLVTGIWNEHLSLHQRVEKIEAIIEQQSVTGDPVTQVNVEGVAGFKDFASELKRKLAVAVTTIPEEGRPLRDKIANLENKSKFFENGRVMISTHIDPEMREMLKYQLTTNKPTHDDLRDGLLLTLEEAEPDWSRMVDGDRAQKAA